MFFIRRVSGASMLPALTERQIVIAIRLVRNLRPGDVVIVTHAAMEKIKRVDRVSLDKLYVLGDNADQSTDSRHFGWLQRTAVLGKVIWPRTHFKHHSVQK
jgi:nickel-type superoxide dismutase maturation protease